MELSNGGGCDQVDVTDNSTDTMKCERCSRHFTDARMFALHVESHELRRHYACDACAARFTVESSLKRHRETTHGDASARHACDICGQTFARLDYLRVHIRRHSGDAPYTCDVCGRRFIRGDRYRMHLRTHSGERPYECPTCGKRFARGDHLKTHAKTHGGALAESLYASDATDSLIGSSDFPPSLTTTYIVSSDTFSQIVDCSDPMLSSYSPTLC